MTGARQTVSRWLGRGSRGRRCGTLAVRGSARRPIEALERRQLFAVIATQTLPSVSATAGQFPTNVDLQSYFRSDTINGTTVRFAFSYGTTNANVDVQLFDSQTPQSVANFLRYVDGGLYNNSYIHRSVPGFVVQGGGYILGSSIDQAIEAFANIPSEFSSSPRDAQGRVNTRGTLAYALVGGDANSGNSQFFFNVADNSSSLDGGSAGTFTTFAAVLGNGLATVDAINNLQTQDLDGPNNGTFDDVPLSNFNPANGLQRSNFVVLTSVARVAPLSFTAVSSDPSVVSAVTDSSGRLTLQYQPNATSNGSPVQITVTATSLNNETLSVSFPVQVAAGPGLSVAVDGTRLDPAGSAAVLGTVSLPAGVVTSRSVVITNTGTTPLSSLNFTLPAGFSFLQSPPTALDVSQSVTLGLGVDSSSYGTRSGTLVVTSPELGASPVSYGFTYTAQLPLTLGSGGVRAVTFTQGGTSATFSLTGPGAARFVFGGGGSISQSAPRGGVVTLSGSPMLLSIALDNTTTRSSLSLSARGALLDIPSIVGNGLAALNNLSLRGANLTGDLTIGTGTATPAVVRNLTFTRAAGARINIGPTNQQGTISVTADTISNSTLTLGPVVRTLSVRDWSASGTGLVLTAPDINTLSIGSNFSGSVTLTGSSLVALNNVTVAGRLAGGYWRVSGDVNRISVGSVARGNVMLLDGVIRTLTSRGDFSGYISAVGIGNVTALSGNDGPSLIAGGGFRNGTQVQQGLIVRATFAGNLNNAFISSQNRIGTITANAIRGTTIFAGANPPQGSNLPTSNTNFANPSFIQAITLRGNGVPNPFSGSVISARSIGLLNLRRLATVSGYVNGIAAVSIGRLTGTTDIGQNLSRTNLTSATPVTIQDPSATQQADLVVSLLSLT